MVLQVFRFLASDCNCYLSSFDTMTVWHLRDIVANKRTRIKCDNVKVIQLPHFEGLTIATILEWAGQHNNGAALRALPSVRAEVEKLPRQYIANVIYTIAGEPFKEWCQEQIEARNRLRTQEHDMIIDMDPEIAKIFKASTSVSVGNKF